MRTARCGSGWRRSGRSRRPSGSPRSCSSSSCIALGAVATSWLVRYGLAVNRLTRGVGDVRSSTRTASRGSASTSSGTMCRSIGSRRSCRHAVVAIEDRRFYHHPGIDPIGLARAVRRQRPARCGARGRQHAHAAARAHAVSLERADRRPQGQGSGHCAADRDAAHQAPDSRAVSESRVSERRRLRRRDDVGAAVSASTPADLTLPEAALIAGLIRAPSALSPWSNHDGACGAAASCSRGCGRRDSSRAQDGRPRTQRRASSRIRSPVDPRGGWAKEYLRQQFREHFGGDHPADWQVHTTVLPALQDAAERCGRRRAAASRGAELAGGARGARSRDRQRPGDGRRQRLHALRRSTAPCAAAPAGLGIQAVRLRGRSRARLVAGSCYRDLARPPPGEEEWTPRNARGEARRRRTDAAAGARRVEQRAAVALQQRVGARPILRLARRPASETNRTSRRWRSAPDWCRRSSLPRRTRPFRTAATCHPARSSARVRRGRTSGARGAAGSRRVMSDAVAFQMVSMMRDVIDRGTGALRGASAFAFPVAGKTGTTNDFKDAWFVGFSRTWWSACGWDSISPPPFGRRHRSARRAAHLGGFHAAGEPRRATGGIRTARGHARGSAVSRLVPASGRAVPDLHRVLQGGRRRAVRALPASRRHPPSERRARDRACGWRAAGEVVGEITGK